MTTYKTEIAVAEHILVQGVLLIFTLTSIGLALLILFGTSGEQTTQEVIDGPPSIEIIP